jgi:putative transposase
MSERGMPKMIVSDDGGELTSNAIPTSADHIRVDGHHIGPGRPVQNAFIETLPAGWGDC